MLKNIANIVNRMLTHLKDPRDVQDIGFTTMLTVRFRLHGRKFDVRGIYPNISVEEIDGSIMCVSKEALEIQHQLNADTLDESDTHDEINESFDDAICAHVDSMSESDVRQYNEDCGGPDLDPVNIQRTWLKTHMLHLGNNMPDLLETIGIVEGLERRKELAATLKELRGKK